MMIIPYFDPQLFAEVTNINTTTGFTDASGTEYSGFDAQHDLSAGMKKFYDGEILENAKPELVHGQFAVMKKLPQRQGTRMEWHKWNILPLAERLVEGVIPGGKKFGQTVISDTIYEFGMYVPVSSRLQTHHVDPVLQGVTQELATSASKTMDKLVRNGLMVGTNVLYCDKVENGVATEVTSRADMTNGNNRLTPDMVNQAYTQMRTMEAPTINGKYVAIIHPYTAYDLRSSEDWMHTKQYADPTDIYTGEIGELHGVRFVVSPYAKVDKGTDVNLTVTAYDGAAKGGSATDGIATRFKVTVSGETTGLVGKDVYIKTATQVSQNTIVGVATGVVYLQGECQHDMGAGAKIVAYGGNGEGGAVFCSIFLGRDAYGTIDPEGGNLRMIIKPASQVGGPLEQFSTAGYKFETNGSKILYEQRVLRVESCSKYSAKAEAN